VPDQPIGFNEMDEGSFTITYRGVSTEPMPYRVTVDKLAATVRQLIKDATPVDEAVDGPAVFRQIVNATLLNFERLNYKFR